MIIVTGATGFIGTYLVDYLTKNGIEVLAVGRSPEGFSYYKSKGIPFINVDITSKEQIQKLPKKGVEGVIHLAALLVERSNDDTKPEDFLSVNTLGTINLLEYCRINNVNKFIYTTSLYEARNVKPPIKEEDICFDYYGDHAPYVISKLNATNYIKYYCEEYGIEGVVLRSGIIRGLRFSGDSCKLHKDDWKFKTQGEKFIEKAIAGEDIEVWGVCGEKSKKRDIIYIKDVVDFIYVVLTTKNISGRYTIASGNPISLEEEVKMIVNVFSNSENPSKIIYRPELNGPKWDIVFDITKTRRDIKWVPQYSYEDMLLDIKKDMKIN